MRNCFHVKQTVERYSMQDGKLPSGMVLSLLSTTVEKRSRPIQQPTRESNGDPNKHGTRASDCLCGIPCVRCCVWRLSPPHFALVALHCLTMVGSNVTAAKLHLDVAELSGVGPLEPTTQQTRTAELPRSPSSPSNSAIQIAYQYSIWSSIIVQHGMGSIEDFSMALVLIAKVLAFAAFSVI